MQKLVKRIKKTRWKSIKDKDISNWFCTKKEALQDKRALFLLSIRMREKTLKFDNIRVNKKEFHKSKLSINLDWVNVDQIVVPGKFKHSNDGFKYFIGYEEGESVKPLFIILPQISGYIKYFENGGKNMYFMVKNDDVLDKYNEI